MLAFVAEKYLNLFDVDFNPYSRINPAFLNTKFALSGFIFLGMGLSIVTQTATLTNTATLTETATPTQTGK